MKNLGVKTLVLSDADVKLAHILLDLPANNILIKEPSRFTMMFFQLQRTVKTNSQSYKSNFRI